MQIALAFLKYIHIKNQIMRLSSCFIPTGTLTDLLLVSCYSIFCLGYVFSTVVLKECSVTVTVVLLLL